jgi:2-methylcitrate dehydratase PrpD
MSVTQDLSAFISQADFRSLTPEVVEVAKTVILDGLGVTLAGSVEPPARIVADYVQEMWGRLNAPCAAIASGPRRSWRPSPTAWPAMCWTTE